MNSHSTMSHDLYIDGVEWNERIYVYNDNLFNIILQVRNFSPTL